MSSSVNLSSRHAYEITRHARERFSARAIPQFIAEMIIEFGESHAAGDGAYKYALTKNSMSELRRFAGREIANALASYRRRNAYVVASAGRIITAAFATNSFLN